MEVYCVTLGITGSNIEPQRLVMIIVRLSDTYLQSECQDGPKWQYVTVTANKLNIPIDQRIWEIYMKYFFCKDTLLTRSWEEPRGRPESSLQKSSAEGVERVNSEKERNVKMVR